MILYTFIDNSAVIHLICYCQMILLLTKWTVPLQTENISTLSFYDKFIILYLKQNSWMVLINVPFLLYFHLGYIVKFLFC